MMAKPSSTTDAMMNQTPPTPDAMMKSPAMDAMMDKLPDQLFAAHFVDSAPMHGASFALAPDKVLINFNFTLDESSAITVTKDNQPVSLGKVMLGERKLSMSTTLPKDAGDGLYVVKYKACWPDKSCHAGQFAFTVNSKQKSFYLDATGAPAVTIRLKDIQFEPRQIIVSQGAQVIWVNDDPVVHFVNTDPHPTHNALPALNSFEIKPGASFSFTFAQPGEWAYHCSAHVPSNMVGRIIVADDQKLAAWRN
jgi:plastocyanin